MRLNNLFILGHQHFGSIETKDSQVEEYVPWENATMKENPKINENMCVDINEEVVMVDEC